MALLRHLRAWIHRHQREREIAAELESHVALRAESNEADGMTGVAARAAAERRLGNALTLRERALDAHFPRWLDDLGRDIGFAGRMLRRSPGFTAIVVLTLGLGIGAATAMFSVVNAVLINTLPFPDASRVMLVRETVAGEGLRMQAIPPVELYKAIKQAGIFSKCEFLENESGPLEVDGFADFPEVYRASPGFFRMLGITPALGRSLQWDAGEIVISNGYWHTEFHADPNVLGHPVRYGNQRYTVAGVLPPQREYPPSADVWILGAPTSQSGGVIVGRLWGDVAVGIALKRAEAAVTVFASRRGLLGLPSSMTAWLSVGPPREDLAAPVARRGLLVSLGAVIFVLLIACANTAALLLARGTGRRRELAVRRALGASRGRLVRQLLTEALGLAIGGGALGWLLAAAALRLARLGPEAIPRLRTAHLDPRVLAFGVGAALLSGLACGLAPALRFSSPDVQGGFQGGAPATRRSARASMLLVVEIALTMVLLGGAALLLRSFNHMVTVSPGFNPHNLVTFGVVAPQEFTNTTERGGYLRRTLMDQRAVARIRALPGVKAASYGGDLFDFLLPDFGVAYHRPGLPAGAVRAAVLKIGPGYFQTLGASVVAGRNFDASDLNPPPDAAFTRDPGKPPPVLAPDRVMVNQALARALWPGGDAVGQTLIGEPYNQCVVIGVVSNLRDMSLSEADQPTIYFPLNGNASESTFLVRTPLSLATLMPEVRQALAATDASLQVGEPSSVDDELGASLAEPRFRTLLLGLFAGLALALALVGLYGALAFRVQQRTREIGVCMALGAAPRRVMMSVLRESLTVLAAGIALGGVLAVGLTRMLGNLLFDVSGLDTVAWIGAAATLVVTGLLASYIPARRAARIDPIAALRCE